MSKNQLQNLMTVLVMITLCCSANMMYAQPCSLNSNFSITDIGNCCYQLQDLTPDVIDGCEKFEWYEINTPSNIAALFTDSHMLCFTPAQNGVYVICYTDCCINSNGSFVFETTCQPLVVNCAQPCVPDPTFSISNLGNCCYQFDDLSPNPVPALGCEHWTFYQGTTVITTGNGSSLTW